MISQCTWWKRARQLKGDPARTHIMLPFSDFPKLPSTKSLLIKGEYHPSAPIHFCISRLSQGNDEDMAVFITPSKDAFIQALVRYNDRWLGKYGGSGQVAAKLSRVKVLFVARIF